MSINNLSTLVNILNRTLINNINVRSSTLILDKYIGNDWKIYKPSDKILYEHKFIRTQLYSNNNYELLLLSWYKKMSGFHNHPDNGCLLKVLEGKLYECVKINNEIKCNILDKNDIGYNKGSHNIISRDKTYSLHIYSPPKYYITNNLKH
jgi:hypothetical protein